MHELALMESLVTAVVDGVGDSRVSVVRLEIGRLAGVVPDALRFCFDVCTQGTVLEGASLEIVEIPGRARCRDCNREVALETAVSACTCGGFDLQILTGQELRIRNVEVS
jgi:hydrogenase nickel incorporation protein HypA/HybF